MGFGTCRTCFGTIAWVFEEDAGRWCPVEPESLDEEFDEEYHGGVLREDWHVSHRCPRPKPRRAERKAPEGDWRFERLHLLPDAPKEVIDAAYRALARMMHPDVGGSNEQMQGPNEAYESIKKNRKIRGIT